VGTAVTIAGTNFGPTQTTSTVTFNGVAATIAAGELGCDEHRRAGARGRVARRDRRATFQSRTKPAQRHRFRVCPTVYAVGTVTRCLGREPSINADGRTGTQAKRARRM
jgi:hypothetical protein